VGLSFQLPCVGIIIEVDGGREEKVECGYLVNSITLRELIKKGIHVVEHSNNLHGVYPTADLRKRDDIREED